MKIVRELVCVVCPNGCRLIVELERSADIPAREPIVLSVSGNLCKHGETYARQECVAPKRMVTTIVRVRERRTPLPVKTAAPVPKEKITEVLAAIHAVEVSPPISIGAVIVANVCGTGVDVVATTNAS